MRREGAQDGRALSVVVSPTEVSMSYGLHVIRFKEHRWGYVGDIPKALCREVEASDSDVTGGRAFKAADGSIRTLKVPSFSTMGEALRFARTNGYEASVTDEDKKAAEAEGTVAYLIPVRLEQAGVDKRGRPAYRWIDGYQVVTPAGGEIAPYMPESEAKTYCRENGWSFEVTDSVAQAKEKIGARKSQMVAYGAEEDEEHAQGLAR